MAMNITELHAENFEQEVVNADRTVGFRPKAELLELIDGIKD